MHFCVSRRFSLALYLLLILPTAFLFLGFGRADLKQLDQEGTSHEKEVELMSVEC